jgi:hypothetical protein
MAIITEPEVARSVRRFRGQQQTVAAADESFEVLDWDTAAFGFGVARIHEAVRMAEPG